MLILVLSCYGKTLFNIKNISALDNLLILVNKNNQLPNDYIPSDLTYLNQSFTTKQIMVKKEVKENFEIMCTDAKTLGLSIKAISGYRSYDEQRIIYDYYQKKDPLHVDSYSAKPGYSEHQTGLAIDVKGGNLDYMDIEKTDEYIWLKNNIHHYGFIIRYQKGLENKTGYKFEPWHLRYVGVKTAINLSLKPNLSYDEYYQIYLK